MMNGGSGGGGQPPMYPRQGQHEIPYSPQHYGPYPQPYQQHQQQYYPQYHHPYPPPQPQWQYYQNMQQSYRPYPQHGHRPQQGYPVQHIPQSVAHLPPTPRSHQSMPGPHMGPNQRHGNPYSSPPPSERSMPQPLPFVPPPNAIPVPILSPVAPATPTTQVPWYPKLPWYSDSSSTFPPAARRRRRKFVPQSPSRPVVLPRLGDAIDSQPKPVSEAPATTQQSQEKTQPEINEAPADTGSAPEETSQVEENITRTVLLEIPTQPQDEADHTPAFETPASETRSTSQARSDAYSTQPTTPSSTQPPRSAGSGVTVRPATKLFPIVPAVPNIPGLNKSKRNESTSTINGTVRSESQARPDNSAQADEPAPSATGSEVTNAPAEPEQAAAKAAPKSWADLVRTKASGNQQRAPITAENLTQMNGATDKSSLAEVLKKFSVDQTGEDSKLAFLKPRGLVNTGNMCYMNAVLQVLLYCIPFYDFLEQVSKNAAHSFKSGTPMVEAMIMFIKEFTVIDAANTVEQLRMRLKNEELEQYGEQFTPVFVYEVIRQLPRFASMRRGHQQDAEEFLGFLLEEMHEECAQVIKGSNAASPDRPSTPGSVVSQAEDGWHEVGPKQRAAITRTSGYTNAESPITKIFGGTLRSEFRVPGTKNSVTFEPYQPLQLDIGSPHVNNITDALKGLTRSEVIHGEFNSPRGPGVTATKQVFIETLPPVLILHLKRFQYDNAGGTQKIWKKVGYPLELEIPKEVFPQHKRGGFAVKGGLPKYKLISVVYHHGKSATGGHYTVDVRRQDGVEWIRLDDTVIRRVRSEDVAEGGSEEDPKILAAALEQHKRDQSSSSNIFDQVREQQEESAEAEKGWSHVNGSSHGGSTSKKWSGVVNGTSTPTLSSGKRTPVQKSSIKDNKDEDQQGLVGE